MTTKVLESGRLAAGTRWFRGDVDGLRAIAILLVVGFHAGLPGLSGGFVGVDVFFVISGYLITRNILRDHARDGRVRLFDFWARRIRRLVPALALMIVAITSVSPLVLSRFELEKLSRDAVAAALYVSNLRFATESSGYFAADVSESPMLHTWSLGVEEQFYIVWPLLVAVAALAVVGARQQRLRPILASVFAAVLIVSFATGVRLTDEGSTWAFYGLPARAWEFAAAGLFATLSLPKSLTRPTVRTLSGLGGLALLVIASTSLSSSTPYPGTAALLPVVGTLLLIASATRLLDHDRPPLTARMLSTPAFQWLGRVSYSWYLWHWPLLVLAVVALDRDTTRVRTVAVVVALPIAWMAFRFVENPIRFRPTLQRAKGRTYALGGSLTIVAVAVSFAVSAAVTARPQTDVDRLLTTHRRGFDPGCISQGTSPNGHAYCVGGDPESEDVIVLVGDSKAAQWFNVTSFVGAQQGLRVAMHAVPGCPFVEVVLSQRVWVSPERCKEFQGDQRDLIRRLAPDVVVLSEASVYTDFGIVVGEAVPSEREQVAQWVDALERAITELRVAGIEPVLVLDNPALDGNPATCIARQRSVADCEPERAVALERIALVRDAELALIDRLDVIAISPVDALCDDEVCHLQVDDYLVYQDDDHLSRRATMGMRSDVAAALVAARARVE